MKRILLILITIILVLHICPLSSLANSNDYSFMDGVTSEKNPETGATILPIVGLVVITPIVYILIKKNKLNKI